MKRFEISDVRAEYRQNKKTRLGRRAFAATGGIQRSLSYCSSESRWPV